MNKTIKYFALTGIISLFFSTSSPAIDDDYAVSHYVEYGIELYRNGESDKSIEQFIKTLLKDSSNKKAKEYLKRLSEIDNGYNRLKLLRFIELVDYYDFLKKRVLHINSNNQFIQDFIIANSSSKPQILKDVKALDIGIKGKMNFDKIETDSQDLKKINSVIVLGKNDLLSELTRQEKINAQLRNFKTIIANELRISKKTVASDELVDQIKDVKLRLAQKEDSIIRQDSHVSQLENKIEAFGVESKEIQRMLKKNEQKILELTRKLAGMSLEIYEKDSLLGNKDSRLSKLEEELIETKERLNLVQHIIQKKDEHIVELENEIMGIQSLGVKDLSGQKRMDNLSDDLSNLNTKVHEQSLLNIDQIRALEEQINILNEKYIIMEAKILKRDIEINLLNQKIAKRDKRLNTYKNIFLSKDQKIYEFNGIVQIYKGKLHDTYAELKSKESEIDDLQKEVSELNQKLDIMSLNTLPDTSPKNEETININNSYSLSQDEILENIFVELESLGKHLQYE